MKRRSFSRFFCRTLLMAALLVLCLGTMAMRALADPLPAHLVKKDKVRYVLTDKDEPLEGCYVFDDKVYTTDSSGRVIKISSKKSGLLIENGKYRYYGTDGKAVTKTWVGRRYFDKNGNAVSGIVKFGKTYYFFYYHSCELRNFKKPREVTIHGVTYCVDKNGTAYTGWRQAGDRYRYYQENGLPCTNTTKDDVKLDKDGYTSPDITTERKEFIAVTIKAREIVSEITNDSMTQSQKLRACWNYMVGGRFYYAGVYPNMAVDGWQRKLALNMLSTHGGNCYGFACAFAALAKACGYEPYVVAGLCPGSRDGRADGLTRHCCVMINGLWYDPEAQYAGWSRGIYAARWCALVAVHRKVAF